jgi:hypothetical protein
MVRRSTVDRSPQLYGTAYDPGAGNQQAGTGKRPRSGPGWRGAGGRWLVWVFRVMAIVLNEMPPTHTPPAPAASTPGFPVQEASAYALQFGQVYLNASPATAISPFMASHGRRGPPYGRRPVRQHRPSNHLKSRSPC